MDEAVSDRKQREGESSGRESPPNLEGDEVWEDQWVVGKEPCFMEASIEIGGTSAHTNAVREQGIVTGLQGWGPGHRYGEVGGETSVDAW